MSSGFSGSDSKEYAGNVGDLGSTPGSERFPGSTKGHACVGFCGVAAPRYRVMFGNEEGAPGNSGVMGDETSWGASFSWLSVPKTICLVDSLLGHTTIPYLRQSSFISLSWKKIWT